MTDVPDDTIEAEQGFDSSFSRSYTFGIEQNEAAVTGTASATTTATGTATGEGAVTGTTTAVTTATGQVTSAFATGTASATTTATGQVTSAFTTGTASASGAATGSIVGEGEFTGTAATQLSASSTITSIQTVAGTAAATTTATGQLPAATSDTAPIEWRVTRDGTTVEDAAYDVDPIVTTANPFGDYGVIKIDDSEGAKFDAYPRGTRVDAAVSDNAGITFDDKFTGYVVERRETEQSGADALEVEAYSFDQFLRRNTVNNDQTGNTISAALADIIGQDDIPVTFNAANVDVGDDQELTRSYQGEPVENVLRDFAFKSNNEEFGVADDLEFFFRPRETEHIDRGIDNTEWFNYDIPELGKETINEVEVWFDDGDRSVIVDDGIDKLDLQDNLNLPSPGTQRAELNRPLITDLGDAEDIGRKYLQFRNATLSGTVTTFGLYDAEPGDTIDITIDPRGIDDEFVIAGIEYRWGRDETILTIVEKRGDVDDILAELNDSVKRQELQSADRDAPSNRVTTTDAFAEIQVDVTTGPAFDEVRYVNDGRDYIRDEWTGESLPGVDTIAYGDDNAGLSRSNSALRNRTGSSSASQASFIGPAAGYEATINDTVSEVGVFTSNGRMLLRGIYDSPTSVSDIEIRLTINGEDSERSVLTTLGEGVVLDILENGSPNLPEQYAYGSGDADPDPSVFSLDNEVIKQDFSDVLVERYSNQVDWETVVGDIPDDRPLVVENGEVTQLQSTQFVEAENADDNTGTEVDSAAVPGALSDAAGISLSAEGESVTHTFDVPYRIPADEVTIDGYRTLDNWDGTVEIRLNNQTVQTSSSNGVTDENGIVATGFINTQIDPGENDTIEVVVTNYNSGEFILDTLHLYDSLNRFNDADTERFGTFDSQTGSFDAPDLFPKRQIIETGKIDLRRDITEARAELQYDRTQSFNNQFIELSNDGSNFTRTTNSTTASATFASPESALYARFTVNNDTVNTVLTPSQGDASDSIQVADLFADVSAINPDGTGIALSRAIIPPGTITGETIQEAGLMDSNDDLLTRHVFAEFTVLADQQVISAETTRFTDGN